MNNSGMNSRLPGLGVPLVGRGAEPQTQNVIVDGFDAQGNPQRYAYPCVAVTILADQIIAAIAQHCAAYTLAELERRGVIPPAPEATQPQDAPSDSDTQ